MRHRPDDSEDEWDNPQDDEDQPDADLFARENDFGEEQSAHACPKCLSTDTAPVSWGARAMQSIAILVLSVSLIIVHPYLMVLGVGAAAAYLLTKPRFRCTRCGKHWS